MKININSNFIYKSKTKSTKMLQGRFYLYKINENQNQNNLINNVVFPPKNTGKLNTMGVGGC